MSVTIEDLKSTEKILAQYFKDIRVLNIWKASIRSRQEYKERLEARIRSEPIFVRFTDNVKSPMLSAASPSNRQPPKGLDACIDKAGEVYDNLLIELHTTELDIITTEEGIEKLEQKTIFVSEVIKALNDESRKVIEMKLGSDKSFEDIGDVIKKSKSSVHDLYWKTIKDIHNWLKHGNAFGRQKK